MSKSMEEQLAELDRFMAAEERAFEESAKKAAAIGRPIIGQYCNGAAHAYHNARCILHVAVLHEAIEPLDVFTVMAIRQARGSVPERLATDLLA